MRKIFSIALFVGALTTAAVIASADPPKKAPAADKGSGSAAKPTTPAPGSGSAAGSGSAKPPADGAGSGSAKKAK